MELSYGEFWLPLTTAHLSAETFIIFLMRCFKATLVYGWRFWLVLQVINAVISNYW